MIIKSIRLKNIRSYRDLVLEFPIGSILLSGDVGAGKSTILYAIEFALFGILKGTLEGESLLRKGAQVGSVELEFEIDSIPISILRNLKRQKNSISQESGILRIGNNLEELTPTELRSRIFDLLGYPKETVSKSKDMIYRYTVYTPQEQMKRIISEDSAIRLEILRRVFSIEKYKRIRDSASVLSKSIKDKAREHEIRSEDEQEIISKLEALNLQIKDLLSAISKCKEEIIQLESNEVKAQLEYDETKSKIILLKTQLIAKENLVKQLNYLRQDILYLQSQLDQGKNLIQSKAEIESKISNLEQSLKNFLPSEDYSTKKIQSQKKIEELLSKKAQVQFSIKNHQKLNSTLSQLSKCPTCMQEVSNEYKVPIIQKSQSECEKLQTELSNLEHEVAMETSTLDAFENKNKEEQQKKLSKLKTESEISVLISKIAEITRLESQIEVFVKQKEQKELQLSSISENLETASKQILEYKDISDLQAKSILEKAKIAKTQKSNQIARLSQELESSTKNIEALDLKLLEINSEKQKARLLREDFNWVNSTFIPLQENLENNVLNMVYSHFNSYFSNWFSLLMEEDSISASLDRNFAPIVLQGGFLIDLENLSGGEKTSCALSYRLAIAKVVNELLTPLKTSDLIILDEPTDGFSNEQLDRMRDVLNQIGFKQIIIVSHEARMESFVDTVIRIRKVQAESKIIA